MQFDTAYFIYGSHAHTPDMMVYDECSNGVTNADVYRFIYDDRGSVRLVVQVTTNIVTQRVDYDVWGAPTAMLPSTTLTTTMAVQPFGFAGGIWMPDVRFWHFGARDYDPSIGRWTTRDPIMFGGGYNLYAYCDNDPVNRIDPSGLDWVDNLDATVAFMDRNGVFDFGAGLGDVLTFGMTDLARDALGVAVDECSGAYTAGMWTGFALGAARLGYAVLVRGMSMMAASGAAASAGRATLKTIFRLGLGGSWRNPAVGRYATDAALRAAAGRTNIWMNLYGAGMAVTGATGAPWVPEEP